MLRPLYRTRQVLQALQAGVKPEQLAVVDEMLTPAQAELFRRMETRDQRHALEVAGRLRDRGETAADLLAAALLHDCGKGAVPVWLRIAYVLAPRTVRLFALKNASGWPGAAYRLCHHPALGAQAAAAGGCSPQTVRLISGKVEPEERQMLSLLIAADDAS